MQTKENRIGRKIILTILCLLAVFTGICTCTVQATVYTSSLSGYQAPPMATSGFHAEEAEGNDSVKMDLSAASQGVIAVTVKSSKGCKFQTLFGDQTYTYNVPNDGTPTVFPIQCGNGSYTFRVMENVTGTKYALLYKKETEVSLKDQFQPFIRPNDYVDYTADSACIKKAQELAQGAETALDVVTSVYDFICKTVTYDYEKAANLQSGYLPDIDETMQTGKGICFDYASLAAAMLRSQGIPVKLVFGYVSPDDLYHAWNMFYTEETGWITVEYQIKGDAWNRLDLTFSANGANGNFIGDGSNYADVFYY